MAIVINGSGTVTGLSVGGLPDGVVDDDTLASGIASSKLTGALPAISGAALTGVSGGLQSQQVFTSSGTWTKPTGINLIKVTVVGGGGSGGGGGNSPGGSNNHDQGSGGGGGGTSIEIIDVTSVSSVSVTIGAGGAGVGDYYDGNAGGTSSFGSYCSATGGAGGVKGDNSGHIDGGSGGAGSGGDLNFQGGVGDSGQQDTSFSPKKGSIGGNSFFGGVSKGLVTGGGSAGRTYGGGSGSGASVVWGTTGTGGSGVVVVEEYIK